MKNKFKILRCIAKSISFLPNSILMFFFEIVSFSESKLFIAIRYILLSSMLKEIGDNVYIGKNVTIKNVENLSIGNNVSIHNNCYFDALGGITIANNISIAHNTTILSSSHTWKELNIPIKYNEVIKKPVLIESDVWIGCGVRILMGVKLHSRSIIAANAVVNKNVNSNSLVGGVPIKFIKEI
ncbi:acyltransferase [Macrococcoides caseolyticum]|uniref:acyltransferase n=1 Tax=Macrococcoides caseolyticum TaxID=69966 RepID=UPI001F3E50DC|nr:acyltransferase [Macrococcus caseolyticus]MCE4955673.1 acyltransferase [Macrococcus caseolyticus]